MEAYLSTRHVRIDVDFSSPTMICRYSDLDSTSASLPPCVQDDACEARISALVVKQLSTSQRSKREPYSA